MNRAPVLFFAAALALLALPEPAAAQVVRGSVAEAGSDRAVDGAFVRLLASDGTRAAATFTDPDGGFALRAPGGGRYRLRVDRLGYAGRTGGWFELGEGTSLRRTVRLEPRATALSDLEVEGEGQCRSRPDEARRTYRVWDRLRTALEAARWWAEAGSHYVVESRRFERLLDRELDPVATTASETRLGAARSTFLGAPAESLSASGWVVEEAAQRRYYGPDARTLLSAAFLADHCFWLTREDAPREGWLGLAFRPSEDRSAPDVRGAFWLDASTGELRQVRWRYTGLPSPLDGSRAGGRVDFLRLSTGPWLIRSWRIRMPVTGGELYRAPGQGPRAPDRVLGYDVHGEELVRLATPEGRLLYRADEGGATAADAETGGGGGP